MLYTRSTGLKWLVERFCWRSLDRRVIVMYGTEHYIIITIGTGNAMYHMVNLQEWIAHMDAP